MILEHFEEVNDKPINYDEDKGKFTIKNKFLWFLNIGNQEIMEKDLSINKINEMKEQADKTTLTDYDINMLYQYAKKQFNYTKSKDEFTDIPIKQIFSGLEDAKLKTNELMPMAYGKEPTVIVENFTMQELNDATKRSPTLCMIQLFGFICVLIFIFTILYIIA